MKTNNIGLISLLSGSLLLAACGSQTEDHSEHQKEEQTKENDTKKEDNSHKGHAGIKHKDGTAEVPEGLKQAKQPKYKKGDRIILTHGHMDGMKGAEGLVAGVYDTTSYVVTYEPVDGSSKVKNHKWVIHEEIKNAQDKPYKKGDKVTLEADHMEGMKGAKAVIEDSTDENVYMVNYDDANTGEQVKFHKWMTESELKAMK